MRWPWVSIWRNRPTMVLIAELCALMSLISVDLLVGQLARLMRRRPAAAVGGREGSESAAKHVDAAMHPRRIMT